MLFLISNFQYLATCLAFSVSKPFRQPIWSNLPFFLSSCALALLATLFVFLPDDNYLGAIFDLLPFSEHYDYRAWLAVGILLNCILTFAVDSLIIG